MVDIRGENQLTNQPKEHLSFKVDEYALTRFEKAFIGILIDPSLDYDFQEALRFEGFFSTKATPLGSNLCLLKEEKKGKQRFS